MFFILYAQKDDFILLHIQFFILTFGNILREALTVGDTEYCILSKKRHLASILFDSYFKLNGRSSETADMVEIVSESRWRTSSEKGHQNANNQTTWG